MIGRILFCLILSLIVSISFAQKFNQIIGTQAFPNLYGCGGQCTLVEAAQEILALGSKTIKINTRDKESLHAILNMPFDTYFFWWRSNENWAKGFSKEKQHEEYQATYNFAISLLTQFKDQEKTFFIGNWESDWYLLHLQGDQITEPNQANADNMAAWINTRQQAIDDARKDVISKSQIYFYAEVNLVLDAMNAKKIRMANAVLPQTNVDYISYSAYDVQNQSQDTIKATLNYLEAKLRPKPQIKGRRVFIGEMGMQALVFNYNQLVHEQKNREILLKFLHAKVPYILYWQIYNNEITDQDEQKGFWLIDNHDQKWPLWYTFFNLYNYQKMAVEQSGNSSYDFIQQQTINYLEKLAN